MIRMIQSQSSEDAKRYFNVSLLKSDYYLKDNQDVAGFFHGKIVARLGIQATITKELFNAFCENLNPTTGKKLTLRMNDNRRVGYDINFHCPKSVSVLHALAKDDHILDAFRQSVYEVMAEIETDAKTRVRKNGKDEDRETGELLWADFIHQTARPVDRVLPDPHLHCHCFVFNVTYDAVEGHFKAGQFGDIKRNMPYYQAKFHKQLSDKLIQLGYLVRRTATAFEIEGVPQPVIDLFSKRTNEIGQIAKAKGITDAKDLDALGARTRAKKQHGLTLAELKKDWRRQIFANGMQKGDNGSGFLRFAPKDALPSFSPEECINHALLARFERASVMPGRRILETAYRFATGNASVTAEQLTEAFSRDKRIIQVKDYSGLVCTTQELLAEEKHMVNLANKGKGVMLPLYLQAPALTLKGEQGDAVLHVLTTTDRVAIISGRAGTGKTTLMQEAVRLIEQTGIRVLAVAPTAEAARGVLRQEGFANAETVANLLTSFELHKTIKDGVLWVDEAGLLGIKDMAALLALATKQNAKVILAGDTRQHSSVVRGDALRILNMVAGIKAAHVNHIYRQRHTDYRETVQALSDGNVKTAFDKLNAMGAIRQIDLEAPYKMLLDDYFITLKKKEAALVISPTHKQGEAVTAAIRHRLRQEGMIGTEDYIVSRLVNRNLTEAEKQDGRNYELENVIQFNQKQPGIDRGSVWSVVAVTRKVVDIQSKEGKKATLPLDKAAGFEVYFKTEISLAKGDTIRITRNSHDANKKKLNNGQIMQVVVKDAYGNIRFQNAISKAEYSLPADFGHIAHAYCQTSHSAQGRTTDKVFIFQPAETFPATNMKQFYVSVSRARDGVHVYTDDAESLLRYASETGDRLSAIELLNRKQAIQDAAENQARVSTPVITPKISPEPVLPKTMIRRSVYDRPAF